MSGGSGDRDAQHAVAPIVDEDAIAILRRMVETRSVSGDESAVATLLALEMGSRGMGVEIDHVGNVIGWIGARAPTHLIVLLGHMDTVEGDIPVRMEGDVLFGRGAVDAKGPLATFIVAASRAALPPDAAIAVVGAVEEETPTSRGARALIDRFRPDACVIGEPSAWNGVTIGYKGRLVVTHEIVRSLSHTAGPSASAADSAFEYWRRVLSVVENLNTGRSGAFETVQASLRELGTTSDGLVERARLVAGFRLPPGVDPHALAAALPSRCDGAATRAYGHECAHLEPRDNAVVRALTRSIRGEGERPQIRVKTGTSDMNVVAPHWRCPIAAYGPGDSALDHTPNEHISIAEYLRATRVLARALEHLADELASTPRTQISSKES